MTESIQKAISYIDENIGRDIDLQEIADHVNYSLSHLHNIFFKVTGRSLASYIRLKKIRLTARELVFGSDTILDIALSVGYSSHEAFTRAFKSEYGKTPKEFRSNPLNRELFRRLGLFRSQTHFKSGQNDMDERGRVKMKSSGEMKNLSGVRQVTFYNGSGWCPEDIPFPSCMSSVMEYLGEPYPIKQLGAHNQMWNQHMGNIYFLGWTGMAFGLLWKRGWHQDICDFMMVDNPEDLVRRAFAAAGREYVTLSGADEDRNIRFKKEVVSSINKGRPVLAFGVIGPPECCNNGILG